MSERPANIDAVEEQLGAVIRGAGHIALQGASGGHLALILARLARAAQDPPLVVVTADEERAQTVAADIAFFLRQGQHDQLDLPEVLPLPAPESLPYAELSSDRAVVIRRMAALHRLAVTAHAPRVLVCSARALRRKVVPGPRVASLRLRAATGEQVARDELVERLLEAGYQRSPVVDDRGTFAVRGAVIDVFPPLARYPARLELFDDQLESLRLFDPDSQRTLRRVEELELGPASEILRRGSEPRQQLLRLADELRFPTRSARAVIDALESGRDFLGIEAFVPCFGQLVPLWSYLDRGQAWVVVDRPAVDDALRSDEQRAARAHAARVEEGQLAFAPAAFFVSADEVWQALAPRPLIAVGATATAGAAPALVASARSNADLVAKLRRAQAERGEPLLAGLARELQRWREDGRPVLIAAGGAGDAERLAALLQPYDVAARSLSPGERPAAGEVALRRGQLSSGFRIDELVVLSRDEIFGPRSRRRVARRAGGPALGDLRQLAVGDHVVHALHGIGRYEGLVQQEVDRVAADFLLLSYAGGDRLYLPIHRMSQIAKYVGGEAGKPRLDRLGGATWQRKRAKVERDVRKLGEDLLQLYAQRAAVAGRALPPPDAIFSEFEAGFPFTETADQQRAIDEVIGDLTAPRPMDRLVCGDVGFGKTEVALRAAFLVAMEGRQVALLAPTTVLVEQHLRTFGERLAPYPLRIEGISRFRRPAELRRALEQIAAGAVDVVVGTHRLLSADVRFADLALLVIDEEQRFGVKHKERLKQLRTQVDVLTMTATPIPRTLQLSMAGLREISVIATPPEDRLAIRTIICRPDEELIADGIRRELARGGQVFFVHNEVQTIDDWAARLARLVPEARVAVGHGRMDSRRLERVMLGFVRGLSDLLVCTTIIESGLDIPRANTMFVNRADRFGLSQLHQLRGRIGRSGRRAYCFLMVPETQRMTGEARARLEALQRFSQLGSGFAVASYDLELRGAGDVLGARQSGHIAAVGFETYARILEEAVAELKGEPIVRETDPDLHAGVPAFIPDDYVEETGQRLELYKRFSDACRDEQALEQLFDELRDRYGAPPPEAAALCALMVVKGLAIELGATALELSGSRLSLTLGERTPLDASDTAALVGEGSAPWPFRLTPEMRLSCQLGAEGPAATLEEAKKVLRYLCARANQTTAN